MASRQHDDCIAGSTNKAKTPACSAIENPNAGPRRLTGRSRTKGSMTSRSECADLCNSNVLNGRLSSWPAICLRDPVQKRVKSVGVLGQRRVKSVGVLGQRSSSDNARSFPVTIFLKRGPLILTVRSIAHQTTLTTKRPPSVMPVSMQRRSTLFCQGTIQTLFTLPN
jgi:hypothetical protein